MRKQTQEEIEKRIYDLYQDSYSVIDKYTKPHVKIRFRHNDCGWIFLCDPYNAFNGHLLCPVCCPQSKNIDTTAFQQKVWNKSGKDYDVLSTYSGMNTPIKMRHKNCVCPEGFHDFMIMPKDFLYKSGICPVERHKGTRTTIEDIQRKLDELCPGYKCISQSYNDPEQFLEVMCDKQHIYKVKLNGITTGNGCPVCNNKVILRGYNDYWTTHPDRAKYLKNPDDGYLFTAGTNKKQYFMCLICKKIHYKKPADAFSNSGRFICECNDGISYPEKYMLSLLKQINEPYIFQLSKTNFDWCDKYRYDFYLINKNTIIETHGLQHYEDTSWHSSFEQIQLNDKNKEHIATNNSIKHYIVIDARYSKSEYIRNSIINSELNTILDLSTVDWNKCNLDANNSIYGEAVKLWKSGISSATKIAELTGVSSNTILEYLEDAGENGICDFNRTKYRENIRHGFQVSVKCLETQEIFQSFAEVKRKLNINLSRDKLLKQNLIGGYHWEMVAA